MISQRRKPESCHKQIQSLDHSKFPNKPQVKIYPNAAIVPQFLMNNLKCQHRVVKQFKGKDAILRSFYFNLMKLAFQLENDQFNYIQLVEQILIGQHYFEDAHNASERQDRNLLKQFFDLLKKQQIPEFEQTINRFPNIDEILMKRFKKIIVFQLNAVPKPYQDLAWQVFRYLCNKFNIRLQFIRNDCFKFLESDIFVYFTNISQVYLVFINEPVSIRQIAEEQIQQNQSQTQIDFSFSLSQKLISKTEIIRARGFFKNKESYQKRAFSTLSEMLQMKNHDYAGLTSWKLTDRVFSSNISAAIQNQNLTNKKIYCLTQPRDKKMNSILQSQQPYSASSQNECSRIQKNREWLQVDSQNTQNMFYLNIADSQFASQDLSLLLEAENSQFKVEKNLSENYEDPQFRNLKSVEKTIIVQNHDAPFFSKRFQDSSSLLLSITVENNHQYSISNTLTKQVYETINNPSFKESDSTYNKFTDSLLLEILDEPYRAPIKAIKQKYKQQKQNKGQVCRV